MRAIWKGSISFGLVNIPIGLYPATRREDISFRQLREEDLSPIRYKRVAEEDGEEVPWEKIVKGYEHEKGSFVVMTDKDFETVNIKSNQTVDIKEFVDNDYIFTHDYTISGLKISFFIPHRYLEFTKELFKFAEVMSGIFHYSICN